MTVNEFMRLLQKDFHSVVIATNDEEGRPATAYMDVMHADETGVYFMTNKHKDIHHRMSTCEYVALTSKKGSDYFHSQMISLRGRIKNIGGERVKEFLKENPYLLKIYPNMEGIEIIDVFQIYEGQGEYVDFSKGKPQKEVISFGNKE